jgi:hypothetical protein
LPFVFVFLTLSLHTPFVPLLIIPLWIYFFQFSSFYNFKQKPVGLGVKRGGGEGVEAWRAGLGPALVPEPEGRAGKRGRGGRRVNIS